MGKKKKKKRKGHSRLSPSGPTPKPAAKPKDDHERRTKLIYVQPPKSSKGKSGDAPTGATASRATQHRM